jgi:hypothetical protein
MAGAISTFVQTHVMMYTNHTFLKMQTMTDIAAIGSWGHEVKAWVTDWTGAPLEGMNVELTADIGTVVIGSNTSDENGMAVFKVDAPSIEEARAAYMTLQVKTAGPALELSLASIKVALQNMEPELLASIVAEGGMIGADPLTVETGVNVSLVGSVYDSNGLWSVYVTVDGGTAQLVPGPNPHQFGSQSRDITRLLGSSLALGDHSVKVTATDGLNVSSEVTLTFEVVEPEEEAGTNWALVGLAIAGWVVVAVLVVWMLMKRPKASAAPAPEEPPAPAAEEPKL